MMTFAGRGPGDGLCLATLFQTSPSRSRLRRTDELDVPAKRPGAHAEPGSQSPCHGRIVTMKRPVTDRILRSWQYIERKSPEDENRLGAPISASCCTRRRLQQRTT